ncbi:MAG TPA: hypothetical protein VMI75_11155 [Polyangiaceae bacterium]|nr:hypothetical protein [Polyangiaceae bacterium]
MRRAPIAAAWSLAFAGLTLAIACGQGMPANSGLTEPLLVHGGQFVSGPLPGRAPTEAGAPMSGDGGAPTKFPALTVTNVQFANPLVLPGAVGKSITGRASTDTAAIGVRIQGLGSGYWVLPIGNPDPDFPGQSDFGLSADFDPSDPTGRHQLLAVAIDSNGNGGIQQETPLCLEQRIPDNLHECIKTNVVPRAVFTLQWDTNWDLDLHVILPDGSDVNPKQPVTVPSEGGPPASNVGKIDRDSMRGCIVDGWREEDLVFPAEPAKGKYDLYVDPFSSCGLQAVRFNMIVSEPGADGNLHPTFTRSGEFTQIQESGGSRGLFVFEKRFE